MKNENNHIALKVHLIEDADHNGFGMGENWEGEFYADERAIFCFAVLIRA